MRNIDLTVRIAETAAFIETQLATDEEIAGAADSCKSSSPSEPRLACGPWIAANSLLLALQPSGVHDDIAEVIDYGLDPVLVHAARHDPPRARRSVAATRALVAAILAETHDYNARDEYYSCSQAVKPGMDGVPGSGCADPERAGRPCDCGRDARVARLLDIIAREWEEDWRK